MVVVVVILVVEVVVLVLGAGMEETEEQRKLSNKFKNAFIKRLQLLWGDEVMKHRNTRRWYRYCQKKTREREMTKREKMK